MGHKSKFTGEQIDARLGTILDLSYLDKIYERTLTIEEASYLKEQSTMRSLFLLDGTDVWHIKGDALPNGFTLAGNLRLTNNKLAQAVITVIIINNEVQIFEEAYMYDLSDLLMN